MRGYFTQLRKDEKGSKNETAKTDESKKRKRNSEIHGDGNGEALKTSRQRNLKDKRAKDLSDTSDEESD